MRSKRLRMGRAGWLALVGALAAASLVVLLGRTQGADDLTRFPLPAQQRPASVAVEDFLGAEACAECHQDQYDRWSQSTHGRAGGAPSPATLIAPFDGTPIVFADGEVVPRVTSEGTYEFLVRQTGYADRTFSVDGVIGGGHMVGGGTQGFVTRVEDGTERFLPFDWSGTDRRWFCNTGTRLDRGWIPVTPDMALADCGDWPPVRVLGTLPRFGNCQGCHGSQITASQAAGEPYVTRYTSLRVNCESCHGPGAAHVELARSGRMGFDGEVGFTNMATLSKDESLSTCFECHALKDALQEGHLPGEPLEDYYALKYPILGEEPFFPDFRVRTFAYQATHLSSACYLQGSMTCVSCHEPHGQIYQDEFGVGLEGRFSDGQCTSCHASKATDVEAHTYHAPSSEGSRCVSCHMPYLQQPEVGGGLSYARSDHTIPLPRPEFDADLGVESACATCHEDLGAPAIAQQTAAWWGQLKPHRPLVQALSDTAAQDTRSAAAALLRPDQDDPLVQFAALGRFMEHHLELDTALEPDVSARLHDLIGSRDLDIRSLALAALHWAEGDDPDTRRTLVEALGAEADRSSAIRKRWVLALSFFGDEARVRGEPVRALRLFEKALEIAPDDGRLWAAAGATYNQAGDFPQAISSLQRAASLDPAEALTYVNLGIAQASSGDVASAIDSYATAARVNPVEPLAFFNLGNLYLRQGSLAEAALAYERAVELDPGLARGHFNLARTYIQLGRYEEALPMARRAVEFEPTNTGAAQMLNDLQRAVGGG